MPVLNGERWLDEAVESVLRQTLRNIELIAVDDGSSDGSRSILDRFARRDSRVTVIANTSNRGVAEALNVGWRAARSSYIARLDADDVALPDRLARQVEFLDTHSSVAAVGGAAVIIDADGRRLSTVAFPTSSRAVRRTLPHRNCLAHPAVTLRKSALERMSGYRIDHVEDYDLWLRLSERFDLANLPEVVILYRQHTRQVSLVALEEQSKRLLAVRAAARARRAGSADPLCGLDLIDAAVLQRLGVDGEEIGKALGRAQLAWAATLAEQGDLEESERLIAQASASFGPRVRRTYAAASELTLAEKALDAGRPFDGMGHVSRALRHDPRYAGGRISGWLRDRVRRDTL
jgi:hypothetical protein